MNDSKMNVEFQQKKRELNYANNCFEKILLNGCEYTITIDLLSVYSMNVNKNLSLMFDNSFASLLICFDKRFIKKIS